MDMKKYFTLLLLLALLAAPALVIAGDTSRSTGYGYLATSQSIYLGPCVLTAIVVKTDGTNAATVTVYDSATGSGEVVAGWTCPGASNACTQDWPTPRRITKRIYVSISGTNASYIVEYFTR
jgi:hypothetical protein